MTSLLIDSGERYLQCTPFTELLHAWNRQTEQIPVLRSRNTETWLTEFLLDWTLLEFKELQLDSFLHQN